MKLDISNKRFGKLLVKKETNKNKYGHRQWECLCDCGNTYVVSTSGLTCGRTKSCGCLNTEKINTCKKDLTNKRFGKLLVLSKYVSNDKRQVKYTCLCDCGKTTIVSYSNLINKQSKCGNCILHKNGCPISKKQIEVFKLMNKGVLNYVYTKSGKRVVIDIAMVVNGKKIAIEYDEWRWHKTRLEKDAEKFQFLIKNNWKVIRICARNNIPSVNQILTLIDSNDIYSEIVLEGWGK